MKKFFLIISCLCFSLAAENKILPVPEGETARELDLNETETFYQDSFENLVNEASERNPFVLAEVLTQSKGPYYNYFDANALQSYFESIGISKNPSNQ